MNLRHTRRCSSLAALGLGLLLINVGTLAGAQQNVDRPVMPGPTLPTAPASDAGAKMLAALKTATSAPDNTTATSPTFPPVWCASVTDKATEATCWTAYRAGLDYYASGLAHRTKVFEWQHVSTILIFFTVLVLVGAGLYFAWIQFTHELRVADIAAKAAASAGPPTPPPTPKDSTIEVSPTGFKISSPVLGVIILALSLAFFYLYLVYAYPIHELI